jgi:hypothetical protein
MVGEVEVTESEARDIKRRLEEYAEVKAKLNDIDGRVHVREKNKDVIISRFCADPHENTGRKGFTQELGNLDVRDWIAQTDAFKKYLKEYRYALYNY